MSLAQQRNEGIHPSSVAALGIKWATLVKKYGFSSLIDHGFSWDNMREMGITAKQACCMLPSQLAALGVNASRLVEQVLNVRKLLKAHDWNGPVI